MRLSGCPVRATTRWIDSVVIGLALCPWAKPVRDDGSLRVVQTEAASPPELARALLQELDLLQSNGQIETTVIVHPRAFVDDSLAHAVWVSEVEAWMGDEGLAGDFQLVAFHPGHTFAGEDEDDASNWTNRSPHPMLHVLLQSSVSAAVDSHPNTVKLAADNRDQLRRLGRRRLEEMVAECTR